MVDVPAPLAHKPEQRYAAAMCGLLAEQNALLAEIRDRLASPAAATAAVSEPSGVVELREPLTPDGPGTSLSTPEETPQPRRRGRPPGSTNAAKRRSPKEGT